jgi:DNA invertase Pin-like site-specific DNA recombinase
MFQEIPIKKPKLIVVTRIDRFGRNLFDLLDSLKKLEENGVGFVSLGDPGVDTISPNGKLLLQLIGIFAEFERNLIRERIKSGRERAKARGVRFGRPPLKTRSGMLNEKKVLEFYQKGVSIRSIARYFGCSTTPIRKILKANGYVSRREVLKLAKKGIDLNTIAKIFSISVDEVNKIIKKE